MGILGADLRREDERTNVRLNPFWVTSALFGAEQTGKVVGLMSFPETIKTCFIHEMVVGVKTAFPSADTPTIDIGYCTLTDDGVDLTYDNYTAAQYIANSAIDATVAGNTIGAVGSSLIVGADLVKPCIVATLSAGMTAGEARLYVLMSRVL